MSKINFTFIRNKFFLAGLFSGIILSAVAILIVFSSIYPPADKNKLTGTMSNGVYAPAVGEGGVVMGSGNYCNHMYCDVIFNNDPDQSLVRCHTSVLCQPETQVLVASFTSGDFCQGGGAYLNIIPPQL